MSLLDEISNHNLQEILLIEENDRQFLALKKSWENIKQTICPLHDKNKIGDFFLLMVLQNSLISYQIAGSGEQRWEEFGGRLSLDFIDLFTGFLLWNASHERFYNLMKSSKYNKRLYNIKAWRLKKFHEKNILTDDMYSYYNDMEKLMEKLAKIMKSDKNSKTIVFAVKMFGYGARIVFDEYIKYPMSISIPVDSRIRRIFLDKYGKMTDKEILLEAQRLSEKSGIPPLHLDSFLRVKR